MKLPHINYLEKYFTALLTTLLVCFIFVYLQHDPRSEQDAGMYDFPFWSLFGVFLRYVMPMYFLVGVPCAVIIEILMSKLRVKGLFRYLAYFILYALSGVLVGLIWFWIANDFRWSLLDSRTVLSLGITMSAALIYFHLSLLIQFLFFKNE